MLGQDILKALGGRDPPIANLFVFDGGVGGFTDEDTNAGAGGARGGGGGVVVRMKM